MDNLQIHWATLSHVAYSKMVVAKGGSFVADRLLPTADAAMLHTMRVH